MYYHIIMAIQSRQFQTDARRQVNTLLNASRHPVYLAPCGTGKTYTAASIIQDRNFLRRRVFVLVPQVEIFDEWMRVLSEFGLNPGYINDEGIRGKDRGVYVCMTLSLINMLAYLPESLYPDEIITDECVIGDTIVETEIGKIRIDELTKKNPKYILSYDGIQNVFNRIIRFIPRGKQPIIEITTETGKQLRCTADHLVYGERGWRTINTLKLGDRIFVNAHADNQQDEMKKDIHQYGCQDTEFIKENRMSNGNQNMKESAMPHPCAHADVETKLSQNAGTSIVTNKCMAQEDIGNISADMTNGIKTGMLKFQLSNNLSLSGHYLVIQASHSQPPEASLHELRGLMVYHKKNGQNIKPEIFRPFLSNYQSLIMQDMENNLLWGVRRASLHYRPFIRYLSKTGKKLLQKKSLIKSIAKVLLGGFAMMDRASTALSLFIPRDIHAKKTKLSGFFSKIVMARAKWQKIKEKIYITYSASHGRQDDCFLISKNTYPNACNTKYERIIGMRNCEAQKVYDLEVQKNHCYFTNGILSHNCQHSMAFSWEQIYRYFPKALRLGLTATLYHGSLRSFEHLYTDVVQTISKSEAIEQNYITKPLLVCPEQWAQHIPRSGDDFDMEAQAEILGKTQIIGNVIDFYERTFAGRPVIVPCCTYEHAEMMTEEFNEKGWFFEHLHSGLGKSERKRILRLVRTSKCNGICTVGIGIEGMSIPGLYGVLWLRRTLSPIVWTQFNGRAERVAPGKEYYVCADFVGNSIIHGMPDRNLSWTLEQEDAQVQEPDDERPVMVTCGRCGVTNSGLNTVCHFCGSPLDDDDRVSADNRGMPAMVDGKLVVVESDGLVAEYITQSISELKEAQALANAPEPLREIPDSEKATILHKNLFSGNRRKLFSETVKDWL